MGFFIIGAALIIVNQLGYLTGISLFNLICTLLLIPVIIMSVVHRSFAGVLFPLALLGVIYAEPLGITALSPWPLLAAALFGSIGLSLIFHKSYYKRYGSKEDNPEHFDQSINDPNSEVVDCRVKFRSSIKYVNSENFQKGIFECSFGAMKVYFDHAKVMKMEQRFILTCLLVELHFMFLKTGI